MTITPERLAEIQARADAATKGPWKVIPDLRPDIVTSCVWTESRQGGHCDDGQIIRNMSRGLTSDGAKHVAELAKNYGNDGQIGDADADAKFIAHARQDVPDLLAEIDRLTKRIEFLGDFLSAAQVGNLRLFAELGDDRARHVLQLLEQYWNDMPSAAAVPNV